MWLFSLSLSDLMSHLIVIYLSAALKLPPSWIQVIPTNSSQTFLLNLALIISSLYSLYLYSPYCFKTNKPVMWVLLGGEWLIYQISEQFTDKIWSRSHRFHKWWFPKNWRANLSHPLPSYIILWPPPLPHPKNK